MQDCQSIAMTKDGFLSEDVKKIKNSFNRSNMDFCLRIWRRSRTVSTAQIWIFVWGFERDKKQFLSLNGGFLSECWVVLCCDHVLFVHSKCRIVKVMPWQKMDFCLRMLRRSRTVSTAQIWIFVWGCEEDHEQFQPLNDGFLSECWLWKAAKTNRKKLGSIELQQVQQQLNAAPAVAPVKLSCKDTTEHLVLNVWTYKKWNRYQWKK